MNKKCLVLLLTVVFICGCSTVPITGRRQVAFVPQGMLTNMSAATYADILSKSTISGNPTAKNQVNKVGLRLARATEEFLKETGQEGDIKYFSWQFSLIKDDAVRNAFALPGGKIAVYSGILPIAKTETGLATIISHEIAHVIAQHGRERMSQGLLVELGKFTISAALKDEPDRTKAMFSKYYGVGTQVGIALPYSRLQEKESDYIGLIIMAKAGYRPEGAIEFWERMNAGSSKRAPEFLSTHPAPKKRIDYIKEKIPEAMKHFRK